MLNKEETCRRCGETTDPRDKLVAANRTYQSFDRLVWHFRCLNVEKVISGEEAITEENIIRYNTSLAQQLLQENAALRHRTSALLRALREEMRRNQHKHGIRALDQDFSLRDEETGDHAQEGEKEDP